MSDEIARRPEIEVLNAIDAECIIVTGSPYSPMPRLIFPTDRLADLRDAFAERGMLPEVMVLETGIHGARSRENYGRPGPRRGRATPLPGAAAGQGRAVMSFLAREAFDFVADCSTHVSGGVRATTHDRLEAAFDQYLRSEGRKLPTAGQLGFPAPVDLTGAKDRPSIPSRPPTASSRPDGPKLGRGH